MSVRARVEDGFNLLKIILDLDDANTNSWYLKPQY